MNSVAGAQARAKEFAHQIHESADDVRDNIQDMGSSVSDMAARQYERAEDTVMDALWETASAAKRNPLLAVGIVLGVGFLFGLVARGRCSKPASSRNWW
jgi:ElaB/YqjD/DUF883 family membrane-anchored ribosome-binding protein